MWSIIVEGGAMRTLPGFRKGSRVGPLRVAFTLFLCVTAAAEAHPGSGIAIDAEGRVYFVDTGEGVWKLAPQGQLSLISRVPYHWMALDERGRFASSQALGEIDGGTLQRITPPGSRPAVIIASDYPIAVAPDGGLYYVPFQHAGLRELIRRTPDGQRAVIATLPADTSPTPMRWVNGIAMAADGSIYTSDNDTIRKVHPGGAVSTFRDAILLRNCTDPMPNTPKLPYLRGLAVSKNGTVYAAATGCRAVIAIPSQGAIETVLTAEPPWSPTGVALRGNDVYVLEYLHTPGGDRKEWIPRVRKISAGRITTLVTIKRRQP
jgi:hypothetical protein